MVGAKRPGHRIKFKFALIDRSFGIRTPRLHTVISWGALPGRAPPVDLRTVIDLSLIAYLG